MAKAKFILLYFLFSVLILFNIKAIDPPTKKTTPWSEKMVNTAMHLWSDSISLKSGKPATWNYEQGILLEAMKRVWWRTGDGKYFNYIQKMIDFFVAEDGTIRTYSPAENNIDNVTPGRSLLLLAHETKKEKYKKAAELVRSQLTAHPRTSEGGFWHKKIYPNQMWLDGLYMGQPFYAEYASLYNQPEAFDDIALQFILMEKHARDAKTGLLYHGWDETRAQKWSDKTTGTSPNFWGRAMGWYAMGLVDVLDYFPKNHPKRDTLIAIFNRLSTALAKYQDAKSGVWYQIVDKPAAQGNYLEASVSSMVVYALAKGVREGYLPSKFLAAAKKGYQGILTNFIETDKNGLMHINKICAVAGLGGNPYRDGSINYYVNEPIAKDDPKGLAPFILASTEIEIASEREEGKGITVTLDYFFNNERKKNLNGDTVRFHYTWEDEEDSGYSFWGAIFKNLGCKLTSLEKAPTADNLKMSNVFIIVDIDTEKETKQLNSVDNVSIKNIADWVSKGGTLVLLANDSGNTNLSGFNLLSAQFGIFFNQDSKNRVINNKYDMGKVIVDPDHPVFTNSKTMFIKEYASLKLNSPAKALVKQGDAIVMAESKFGKGTVFAIGDPWLYNEYVDGKRLPDEFDNFKAAKDLAKWLILQSKQQTAAMKKQ